MIQSRTRNLFDVRSELLISLNTHTKKNTLIPSYNFEQNQRRYNIFLRLLRLNVEIGQRLYV